MTLYHAVPSPPVFPDIEESVLRQWEKHDVARRAAEPGPGRPTFTLHEGPPTPNGPPGAHHVEARVFKDVYLRFMTMCGYHVVRRQGWAFHGLPVESAVEKELGLASWRDVEAFGIDRFNARCRARVERHVAEFERLTVRIGYWVDLDDSYSTMADDYVESVWWSLARLFELGLLVEEHRTVPYCSRCGTNLSELEAQLGSTTSGRVCWRCATVLVDRPMPVWYLRLAPRMDDLTTANESVVWLPGHIKHGLFGEWLCSQAEWALSRQRYWGTPLPIWRCDQGHTECFGSVAELSRRAGRELAGLELHRPFVDNVVVPCRSCPGSMRRVPLVIDAWYDSGAMSFAQWHHPFEGEKSWACTFPAQYVAEAVDETRAWLYASLVLGALLFGRSSYETALCLGHLVDSEGRRMSKLAGNAVDPWTIFDRHGADPFRWFLLTAGSPWDARRLSDAAIEEASRPLWSLWDVYARYVRCANEAQVDASTAEVPVAERSEADRRILAELEDTVGHVTDCLERFDCTAGGRRLGRFIHDLSAWYLPRSEPRWQAYADSGDRRAAYRTAYECLTSVATLLAPYVPFLAEEMWSNLAGPVGSERFASVHLTTWPQVDRPVA